MRRSLGALLGAMFAWIPLYAQAVELLVLEPVADTVIYFDGVDGTATVGASNARGESLGVGVTAAGEIRRSLLRFDLSAVMPGSVVLTARLSLFETRSRADYDVALHRLTLGWGEGNSNGGTAGGSGTATAGDATWLKASHPNGAWASAGGDYIPSASALAAVGGAGVRYEFSSEDVVADVQRWVDAPAQNHGWILIGGEGGNQNAKLFGSRESAVAPALNLTLLPVPEPSVAMMLILGLGLIGWKAGRGLAADRASR